MAIHRRPSAYAASSAAIRAKAKAKASSAPKAKARPTPVVRATAAPKAKARPKAFAKAKAAPAPPPAPVVVPPTVAPSVWRLQQLKVVYISKVPKNDATFVVWSFGSPHPRVGKLWLDDDAWVSRFQVYSPDVNQFTTHLVNVRTPANSVAQEQLPDDFFLGEMLAYVGMAATTISRSRLLGLCHVLGYPLE